MTHIRLVAVALAVLAAAPLAAQPDTRRLPTCIREASAAAGTEMTRHGCAGTGMDEAVRLSVSLPARWEVAWQDTADLQITAMDGDNAIYVVGGDQLPAPLNRADTLAFWRRATELRLRREVTDNDVRAFRDEANGRAATARELATREQLTDSALLALVQGLSVTRDGHAVLRAETEVRILAGEPAGYLSEVAELGGVRWRLTSYATYRDGAIFLVSLNTLEPDHDALLPVFERVLASFDPRTERW
ncbi:hypothetical protein [Longimicrobium sp.]|uniref:hypothetical protein n=1 Tax=Longimicrobium sp. TaxID=2029185 RepID=UPI002E35B106|nr:hypothetical protein [Longimicrobium sp.]HEX6039079.1 hypothetical protein [Longimicrobium sp.]